MTFRCDSTTRAELDASPSKLADTAVIQAALGSTRRIRCKRHNNAAATADEIWTNGVEFRNTGSTGSLKVVGGKVVGLGRLKASTVQLAADVGTGASIMRIEGNGRWLEVSLGGPGSGKDVEANGYFTATNGLALKPNFAISGKMFKPSGTGPAAPELDVDAPVAFRVTDYTNPANPVVAGTAQMNVRDLDMVMDHPQIASEMGDVRIQRCADGAGVVLGTGGDCFRIAATALSMNKACNEADPTKPVHQVVLQYAPHGRWPSYPFSKDLNSATDTTIMPPFKVELLRANGTVLDVIEMYSTRTNNVPGTGLAMNSPAAHENPNGEVTHRPYITCFQMTKWQSHKIKKNSKALHYLPGVEADALHPTNVTAFDAAPLCWPVMTGRYLSNGLGSWRIAPKWSRGGGAGVKAIIDNPVDTYFSQPTRDDYITQVIGWGYEPGSNGHHTWYMSPGGSRTDRACWPHVMVDWASDPTGNRIHGNVPKEELKDAWLDNYFNEGCHYFPASTLERGYSIDKTKLVNGHVCYSGTYYAGGNENFVPDTPNNNIALLTAQNAQDSGPLDKYGRRFNNEYQRDNQHSYSNGALGVYINNSPAHVLSARATFNSHILCAWGMTQGTFSYEEWLTRQHAWHEWQFTNMWIATSSDERTLSRNELEGMWERHLHAMHDVIMPRYLHGTDVWSQGLRNCGVGMKYTNDGVNHGYLWVEADSKLGYMGQALLLMKQSGAWDAMCARSVKCREILELLVNSLGKATADCFIDGNGRADNWGYDELRTPVATPLGEPTWFNVCPPRHPDEDWIHRPDGSLPGPTAYTEYKFNTMHMRAQCVWVIQRYFPDLNNGAGFPRINEAATKLDGWYNTIEQRRIAGTGAQWHYRFAMMGKFKAPAIVGAPTIGA